MSGRFYRLQTAAIHRETATAISIEFDLPEALRDVFQWRSGQHVILRFWLDGEDARRPYSISSSPFVEEPLRITVQRVVDGLVSNHIHDSVTVGSEIEVMPPLGGFSLDPVATEHRTHYFFGAGSGITPLYSMLRSVLEAEPRSAVHLLYGNRGEKDIIFRQALVDLTVEYPERLAVVHTLSSPSMWSSFEAWTGRVDAGAVNRFIDQHPPYAQDAQYYVCGPGRMNACVRGALMDLDVPAERIHLESYGPLEQADEAQVVGVDAVATVTLGGKTATCRVPAGHTVLAGLLDAGWRPPYSCQAGVCSACRARLVTGEVHLRSRVALEDHEIATGAILTCQAVPLSDALKVRFDD